MRFGRHIGSNKYIFLMWKYFQNGSFAVEKALLPVAGDCLPHPTPQQPLTNNPLEVVSQPTNRPAKQCYRLSRLVFEFGK